MKVHKKKTSKDILAYYTEYAASVGVEPIIIKCNNVFKIIMEVSI